MCKWAGENRGMSCFFTLRPRSVRAFAADAWREVAGPRTSPSSATRYLCWSLCASATCWTSRAWTTRRWVRAQQEARWRC